MPRKLFGLTILVFAFLQACAVKPFNAPLSESIGESNKTKIQLIWTCDSNVYLSLDDSSKNFEIVTRPNQAFGYEYRWKFQLGKTLSLYLQQTQKGKPNKLIPIEFYVTDFQVSLGGFIAKVDSADFTTHFSGPPPIGRMTFSETFTADSGELFDTDEKAYAVNQALRSTTVKFFEEVNKRVCGNSTGGGKSQPTEGGASVGG